MTVALSLSPCVSSLSTAQSPNMTRLILTPHRSETQHAPWHNNTGSLHVTVFILTVGDWWRGDVSFYEFIEKYLISIRQLWLNQFLERKHSVSTQSLIKGVLWSSWWVFGLLYSILGGPHSKKWNNLKHHAPLHRKWLFPDRWGSRGRLRWMGDWAGCIRLQGCSTFPWSSIICWHIHLYLHHTYIQMWSSVSSAIWQFLHNTHPGLAWSGPASVCIVCVYEFSIAFIFTIYRNSLTGTLVFFIVAFYINSYTYLFFHLPLCTL